MPDDQRDHGGDHVQQAAEGEQQQDHGQRQREDRGDLHVTLAGGHLLVFQHRHAGQPAVDPLELRLFEDFVQSSAGSLDRFLRGNKAALFLDRQHGDDLLLAGALQHGWLAVAAPLEEGIHGHAAALLPSKALKPLSRVVSMKVRLFSAAGSVLVQIAVDLAGQAGEEGLYRGGCCQILQHRRSHGQGVAQLFDIFQRHEQQAVLAEVGQAAGIEYLAKNALFPVQPGIERICGAGRLFGIVRLR